MTLEYHVLEKRIYDSIGSLIENDSYLFEHDANERTISHRFALYLERHFNGWNIDCEYNRNGHEVKALPEYLLVNANESYVDENEEDKKKSVFPDVIIHHRGHHGKANNLLAIEIKKTSNSTPDKDNFDFLKLMAFKSELKYNFTLFLKFNTGNRFKKGRTNIEDNVIIKWDPEGILDYCQ